MCAQMFKALRRRNTELFIQLIQLQQHAGIGNIQRKGTLQCFAGFLRFAALIIIDQ